MGPHSTPAAAIQQLEKTATPSSLAVHCFSFAVMGTNGTTNNHPDDDDHLQLSEQAPGISTHFTGFPLLFFCRSICGGNLGAHLLFGVSSSWLFL